MVHHWKNNYTPSFCCLKAVRICAYVCVWGGFLCMRELFFCRFIAAPRFSFSEPRGWEFALFPSIWIYVVKHVCPPASVMAFVQKRLIITLWDQFVHYLKDCNAALVWLITLIKWAPFPWLAECVLARFYFSGDRKPSPLFCFSKRKSGFESARSRRYKM